MMPSATSGPGASPFCGCGRWAWSKVAPASCADPGLAVTDLAELVCRGGWPAQLERPQAAACRAARDYLEQVRQVDVRLFGSRPRDLSTVFAMEDSFAFGEESWDFIFSRPLRRH